MKKRHVKSLIYWLVIIGIAAVFVVPSIQFKPPFSLVYNQDKTMVLVPGSSVTTGGDFNGDYDETTAFTQDLRAYWLSVREVGAKDFAEFLLDSQKTPIDTKLDPELPASGVSWYEAIAYCNWLSDCQGLQKAYTVSGKEITANWLADGYRLPSETEWENATKGGPYTNHNRFSGSSNVEEVAHFRENSNGLQHRATLKPNELGLYDMSGNVAEWVWDRYGMFNSGAQQDYRGPASGEYRVIRGGAWDDDRNDMRVGDRNYLEPETHDPSMGFRVARTATGQYGALVVLPATSPPMPYPPEDAPYKDPKRTVDERVADLMGRMSLEEKIGQMTQIAYAYLDNPEAVGQFHLGSVITGGDMAPESGKALDWANLVQGYQKSAIATRLGIPILFAIDAVHGDAKVSGATIFPQNVGLGAANDPALMEQMGRVVALEMQASGQNWNFAPCLAVSRDERWGRSYESFGEDPNLASRLGAAYIRGLQGREFGGNSVVATAKHFLADGGTQGGKDRGNAVMSEDELRRIHLAPYKAAVAAGTAAIMVSFSSWNDTPMHANRRLLVDVLRGELGFKGVLVSDWGAQKLLLGNPRDQVKTVVNAGIDVCMVPDNTGRNGFAAILQELVISGEVPIQRINEAVEHMLTLKFKLGLFEHPYGATKPSYQVGQSAHRAVARQLVAKSQVILKNNQAIPLSGKLIWIGGSLAGDSEAQCGGWTMGWQQPEKKLIGVTGIQEALLERGQRSKTRFVAFSGSDVPKGPVPDLAIVISGEQPYAEFEGDRQDLSLPMADQKLIQALKAKGCKVLLLVVSGRPMMLGPVLPQLDGVVACWLPGSEGGGVADVLFGDVKASGKLPVSWPTGNDQVPVNAGDGKVPLFPLGFGFE